MLLVFSFPVMQRFFKHLLPPVSHVHSGPIKSHRFYHLKNITLPAEPQIDGLCNIQYFYYRVSDKFKIFVQKQSAMAEKIIHNNLWKESSLTVNVMTNPSTQVVS
jgi:hypothetical protein